MTGEYDDIGPYGPILERAIISALPDSTLAMADVRVAVRRIFISWCGGWDEEQPNATRASAAISRKELTKLHDLASSLRNHLDQMHQPAMSALWAEGLDYHRLKSDLDEAREIAAAARSMIGDEANPGGRPRKIQAAYVTETAEIYYNRLSGREATYTTNPHTGNVTGPWPDFLAAVFSSLSMDDSVTAQVQALRKKTRASREG